jgi:hypothetical protein
VRLRERERGHPLAPPRTPVLSLAVGCDQCDPEVTEMQPKDRIHDLSLFSPVLGRPPEKNGRVAHLRYAARYSVSWR